MQQTHRIAAGAIIIRDDQILLVRYTDSNGGTYLVAPGGALETNENAFDAAVRETLEETRVTAVPQKVLLVEDLLCKHFKMCKIWLLCNAVGGTARQTDEGRAEGIIEVGWFDREHLRDEVVYPHPILLHEWQEFMSDDWQVQCMPSQVADF